MINTQCPSCGAPLQVKEEAAGRQAKCPRCGHVFQVPPAFTLIPVPVAGAAPAQNQGSKATSGFGIAGLVLGLLACPTAWIPLVGFLTIPISVLGLVFGGVGIFVSAMGKRTRLEMPIAAVVVSFVALVLALWVVSPAITEAIEDAPQQALMLVNPAARSAASLANLRQLCVAAECYATSHNRALPPTDTWPDVFKSAFDLPEEVLADPAKPKGGRAYAMNAALKDMRMGDVPGASRVVLFFECAPGTPPAGGPKDLSAKPPHANAVNIGFVDGHVALVKLEDLGQLIWDPKADPPKRTDRVVSPTADPPVGPRLDPPEPPEPPRVRPPDPDVIRRGDARAKLLPRFEAATNEDGLLMLFKNLQLWRTTLQVTSKDANRFTFSGTGFDESVLPPKDLTFSGRINEEGHLILNLSNRSGELVFDVFLDTGAFSMEEGAATLTPLDKALREQTARQQAELARILAQPIPDPIVTLYDGNKPADLKKINSLRPSFAAAEVTDTRALAWVDGQLDTGDEYRYGIGTYAVRYKEPPKTRSIGLVLLAGYDVPTLSVTINGQRRIPLPSWESRGGLSRVVLIELRFRDVVELVELRFDVLAGRLPLYEIVMLDVEGKTPPAEGKSDSRAAGQLNLARAFLRNGLTEKAATILRSILSDYPGTPEAEQAQQELDNIEQISEEKPQAPRAPPPRPPPTPTPPAERSAVPPALIEANAQGQLEDAKLFEQKAAGDLFRRVEVLRAYQDVVDTYPGTKAAEEAAKAIERLRQEEKAPKPSPAAETPAPAKELNNIEQASQEKTQAPRPPPPRPPSSSSNPARQAVGFFAVGGGENVKKIVYVVDRSGSMSDSIDYVKFELKRSIGELSEEKEFDVIFYSSGTPVEMPTQRLVNATERNKQSAFEFVDSIVPQGETDPSKALERAFACGPELIYLLTDGEFDRAIIDLVQRLNVGKKVTVHGICFLYRTGEAVMKTIAEQNGGNYKFVSEQDLAPLSK